MLCVLCVSVVNLNYHHLYLKFNRYQRKAALAVYDSRFTTLLVTINDTLKFEGGNFYLI